MNVLFDKGTPSPLRRALRPHAVTLIEQMGWPETIKNGDLLRAAEQAGFAAIVTTDTKWREQQNLRQFQLAVIVLRPAHWPTIRPCANEVKDALDQIQPGEYRELRF
jgi:hypothetical protein